MYVDKWFIILSRLLKKDKVVGIAVVTNCHGQVAEIATSLGAFDRAALEALIKLNG